MAGVRMVAAGVDSMSRASEFVLARTEYDKLNADVKWGRRWGFKGFTVDLCASQKTTRCRRYYSKDGMGEGSLGDARTADLQRQELYYVVPPVGMIEQVLKLLTMVPCLLPSSRSQVLIDFHGLLMRRP